MHDLEVLIARTRGVQGSPSAPNLRLSGDLDQLVRRLETECRQLHGHYMALRPQLLAICDRVDASAAARRVAHRRRCRRGRTETHVRASSISCATPSPPSAARSGPTTTSGR